MITIVFTTCMMAKSALYQTCIDRQIPTEADVKEIHMCEKNAMPALAKWVSENPEWWVTRFKCVDADKDKKEQSI